MFNKKKQYIYPKNWDDEDIIRFKYYLKEAKEMYDRLPEDAVELCCYQQIQEEKGLCKPIDHSKIEKVKLTTPPFESFDSNESFNSNEVSIEA